MDPAVLCGPADLAEERVAIHPVVQERFQFAFLFRQFRAGADQEVAVSCLGRRCKVAVGDGDSCITARRQRRSDDIERPLVSAGRAQHVEAWEPEVRVDLRRFSLLRARLQMLEERLERLGAAPADSAVNEPPSR